MKPQHVAASTNHKISWCVIELNRLTKTEKRKELQSFTKHDLHFKNGSEKD